MTSNNAVILKKAHRFGPIKEGETLEFVKRPYDLKLEDGGIIVKAIWLSIDPYLRGRIREPGIHSYTPEFKEGRPIDSQGVGEVFESKNPKYKKGQYLQLMLDWAEYTLIKNPNHEWIHIIDEPLSEYTGILGMPGFTAYSGLKHIAKPKKGETIFVSAASGAVGQVVGQLCLTEGLHVVGSAGDDKKVDYIKELGFTAFNYKKENTTQALHRLCPKGIDIYWDNVGGKTLDAALLNMNDFGRIVACGMISTAGQEEPYGVKHLRLVVARRLLIQGFIQHDLFKPYYEDFQKDTMKFWKEGKIKYREDVTEGLENAIQGLIRLFEGKNFGKAVIKV